MQARVPTRKLGVPLLADLCCFEHTPDWQVGRQVWSAMQTSGPVLEAVSAFIAVT